MDPEDPIIQTYEKAFPGMFTPASKMSADLKPHLRYPEDIFTVQATMYGKYHITERLELLQRRRRLDTVAIARRPARRRRRCHHPAPPTPRASRSPPASWSRMAPIYQELQVPGQTQQSFNLLDAFVPVSGQSQIQTLSGFMIAGSDPGHYGQLADVRHPAELTGQRPGASWPPRSMPHRRCRQQITLLNQNGSSVLLGNVLMIPVANSLLYIQPLYVESSRNPFPGSKSSPCTATRWRSSRRCRRRSRRCSRRQSRRPPAAPAPTGALSPQVRSLLDAGPDPVPAVPDRSEGRQPGRLPDRHHDHGGRPRSSPAADRRHGHPDHHHDDHHHPAGSAGPSGSAGSSGSGSSG